MVDGDNLSQVKIDEMWRQYLLCIPRKRLLIFAFPCQLTAWPVHKIKYLTHFTKVNCLLSAWSLSLSSESPSSFFSLSLAAWKLAQSAELTSKWWSYWKSISPDSSCRRRRGILKYVLSPWLGYCVKIGILTVETYSQHFIVLSTQFWVGSSCWTFILTAVKGLLLKKCFLWNTLVRGLWQSLLWGEGLGWWLWNAKLQVCLGALKLWVRGVLQPWGEGNRLVSWREGGLLRVESSSEPRGRVTGLWGQDLQNCLNHQCMSSVALVPPVIYLNIPIIWKINVSFQKKHVPDHRSSRK